MADSPEAQKSEVLSDLEELRSEFSNAPAGIIATLTTEEVEH